EEKLRAIIELEDQHCPFTDEQIAKKLNTRSENVTTSRKALGIEDSRERLKGFVSKYITEQVPDFETLSDRGLTARLNGAGFIISRNAVGEIKKTHGWYCA
ncbi:MAG: hypothetical protein ACRCSI_09845, partial [Eubacterium aggregans]